MENGTKFISLKSILNIKNHYIQPVNVFIKTTKNGKNLKQLTQILPEKTFNVPLDAVYSEPYEFYFQIHLGLRSLGNVSILIICEMFNSFFL